jgi:cobaltochelatase CobN
VSDADYAALWSYLVEGGLENARRFLRHAGHMLDGAEAPPPAAPLLRAGVFWPGEGRRRSIACAPTGRRRPGRAGGVLPRADAVGRHRPVAQLTKALRRRGLNPLPVFVASLKDSLSRATLLSLLPRRRLR